MSNTLTMSDTLLNAPKMEFTSKKEFNKTTVIYDKFIPAFIDMLSILEDQEKYEDTLTFLRSNKPVLIKKTSTMKKKKQKPIKLKNILSSKSLHISGNKPVLVDRVWGIIHPNDMVQNDNEKVSKKVDTKKTNSEIKVNNTHINIEDTDSDCEEDTMNIHQRMEEGVYVYINMTTNKMMENESDETETYLQPKGTNWLFKDNNDELEFEGVVEDNTFISNNELDEIPPKLLKMYDENS